MRASAYLVKPPTRQTLIEVVTAVRAHLSGAAGREIPKISGELFEAGADKIRAACFEPSRS